jgi:hypothetical protein
MKRVTKGLIAGGIAAMAIVPVTSAGADVAEMHWGASSVSVDLPTCTDPSCAYRLSVDEPDNGDVIIGIVNGSSGTLSVQIPPFCGTVQADLYLGDRLLFGRRHVFATCTPPTTTTTTVVPPTTTIPPIVPKPPVSVPPAPPAALPPVPQIPTAPVSAPLPQPAPSAPVSASAPIPTLAYTGVNWKPLAGIGGGLVGLGSLLLTPWRRLRRS